MCALESVGLLQQLCHHSHEATDQLPAPQGDRLSAALTYTSIGLRAAAAASRSFPGTAVPVLLLFGRAVSRLSVRPSKTNGLDTVMTLTGYRASISRTIKVSKQDSSYNLSQFKV